jgi:hypothetical protein
LTEGYPEGLGEALCLRPKLAGLGMHACASARITRTNRIHCTAKPQRSQMPAAKPTLSGEALCPGSNSEDTQRSACAGPRAAKRGPPAAKRRPPAQRGMRRPSSSEARPTSGEDHAQRDMRMVLAAKRRRLPPLAEGATTSGEDHAQRDMRWS